MLHYFAYGSNLHPLRLMERVIGVTFVDLITVKGYQLRFHKRQDEDGSGKCNMFFTGAQDDAVIGAVYTMPEDQKSVLDTFEGRGYRCEVLNLNVGNAGVESFVYIAEESHIDENLTPHDWYKQLVLLGALYHDFPEHYVNQIRGINAILDPDPLRRDKNVRLIAKLTSSLKTKD